MRDSAWSTKRAANERGCVRTGSWTGPPRGKRAPRVGISSTIFGVTYSKVVREDQEFRHPPRPTRRFVSWYKTGCGRWGVIKARRLLDHSSPPFKGIKKKKRKQEYEEEEGGGVQQGSARRPGVSPPPRPGRPRTLPRTCSCAILVKPRL